MLPSWRNCAPSTKATTSWSFSPDEERARRLGGILAFFGTGNSTRFFPAWDCLPYDRVSPQSTVAGERLALMGDLSERREDGADDGLTVLTTARAMLQRVPSREAWKGRRMRLRMGGQEDPVALVRSLTAMGYTRSVSSWNPVTAR